MHPYLAALYGTERSKTLRQEAEQHNLAREARRSRHAAKADGPEPRDGKTKAGRAVTDAGRARKPAKAS